MTQIIELEANVIEEIQKGRKVQAIKNLRNARNIGLKEAKQLVDAYCLENKVDDSAVVKLGNTSGIIFFIIFAVAAYFIYTQLS